MAFLGTLAGIWFSLFIAFFGLLLIIAAAGVSSLGRSKVVQVNDDSYLKLVLAGELSDRPGQLDHIAVMRGDKTVTQGVNEIVGSIDASAGDDRIDGIVIDCRGSSAGLAKRQAIVEALKRFKDAQGDYYVATAADSIFINPIGQIDIHGLSSTRSYFKNLLYKLGVDVQVVKVGTYKSAVEPYILDGISAPAREQEELFLSNIWENIAGEIAEARKVSADTVNHWANGSIYAAPTEDYVKMHIADRMVYRHEFDSIVAYATGVGDVNDLNPVTPAEYCQVNDVFRKGDGGSSNIAVL